MSTRTPVLIACLVILAGCAEPKADAQDEPSVASDPVSEEVGGVAVKDRNASYGIESPFLLSARMGPDFPLTAFQWRVPEGAIIAYQPLPNFPDIRYEQIHLDVVPVYPEGVQPPTEFAVMVFRLDGEAQLGWAWMGVPLEGSQGDGVTSTPIVVEPTLDPSRVTIGAGALEEGDRLGIVVAAYSAQASDFGLLFSPWSEHPGESEVPQDAETLLAGRTPLLPPEVGNGTGMQTSMYVVSDVFLPPLIVSHYAIHSPSIVVDDASLPLPEPYLVARDLTVKAEFPSRGYSDAVAAYSASALLNTCTVTGTYDVGVDLHGSAASARNLMLPSPLILVPPNPLTGTALARGVGNGEGGATTSFDVVIAGNCGYQFIAVDQMSLGATIEDLLGVPPLTGASAGTGLAGDIPPSFTADQGDLVMQWSDREVRIDGAGAGFQRVLDEARSVSEAGP